MTDVRAINIVLSGQLVIEGAGVHLQRLFGFGYEHLFDPFLLLDDFRSDEPDHYLKGFPAHPHRGIETITYVLKGEVEHQDSLGNGGVISAGQVQWMTAGNGIIHQEMPKGDKQGSMHGFQLWANLPASDKMMHPRYRDIRTDQIPEVVLDSSIRVKVIAGSVGGVEGPVNDVVIDPQYLDVSLPAGVTFKHPAAAGHTLFIYVIGGVCQVAEQELTNGMLALFSDGDEIRISTGEDAARVLLISGKPLNEPIAWRGPIVMNTTEELELAFAEFEAGSFIKHNK